MKQQQFTRDILKIDALEEIDRISSRIKDILAMRLKRRGLIVALSGGIDSSVTTALAIRALGKERVFVLLLPERHSSPDTLELSRKVVEHYDVPYIYKDITPILDAVGFYQQYESAVKEVIPEYGTGWKSKIVLPNILESKGYSVYSVVAQGPDGQEVRKRLPSKQYLEIVAATNFKQRIRKMLEYYHADRLHYAVAGTPNRLELDQGFFVKLGDGAADLKPIAHLYKSQVYQLGEALGVPPEIAGRPPTTDTYELPQGQDEFYFSLPYNRMDLCLYALNNDIPAKVVGDELGYSEEQVTRIYEDIRQKRSTTEYLHLQAQHIEEIPEIGQG